MMNVIPSHGMVKYDLMTMNNKNRSYEDLLKTLAPISRMGNAKKLRQMTSNEFSNGQSNRYSFKNKNKR